MPDMIPELDLTPLVTGTDCAALAANFAEAYGRYGFAYVTHHGIAPELIEAVFAANRAFHALPDPDKHALALDGSHRGYIAQGTSTDVTSDLAEVTKPNQSASFMVMREDATADPRVYLSGPNRWPDLPGFRETCETYVSQMSTLAHGLLGLAFQGLGGPRDLSGFETPTTWLRLLHYPPRPAGAPEDLYGSAPHRDFGALTLLATDAVGGLQVLTPGGAWVDVPPRPDVFVVNVGDMLHRMSNGRLRSTPHRVINRSGRARYSVPFFFDPHVSCLVAPAAGLGAPRFPPLVFGEFLRSELEAGYRAHQPGG